MRAWRTERLREESTPDRALEHLFHSHFHDVRNYVARHYPSAHVDDVVSMTFIKANEKLDQLEEGKERAWLIGISRNIIRNTIRAERRRSQFVDALIAARPRLTAELQSNGPPIELRELFTDAFSELREADQEILLLSIWEGLSAEELGQVLRISAKQATDRLHRAKRRFRVGVERRRGEP